MPSVLSARSEPSGPSLRPVLRLRSGCRYDDAVVSGQAKSVKAKQAAINEYNYLGL